MCKRFRVIGIHHCDAAARQVIAEQLPQFFQAFVIEADIQKDPDGGTVERDRSVAFVHLADIEALTAGDGARERTLRIGEILHHRAVHDGRFAAQMMHDPAEHPGDGGFPARPRHGKSGAAGVEQDRIELGAGQAQASQILGTRDIGHAGFHCGGSDHDLILRDDAAAVLGVESDALGFQRRELFRRAALIETAVRAFDPRASSAQDLGQRQHAGSPNADEKERAGQEVFGRWKFAHDSPRYGVVPGITSALGQMG